MGAIKTIVQYCLVQLLDFDPCSDYYVHAYMNTPEVQKALHANVTKLSYDWESCRFSLSLSLSLSLCECVACLQEHDFDRKLLTK